MTVVVLAGLAVLLSGPVPALLSRVSATRRTPRAAMVLWQAIALAAVLAALGASLALVTAAGPLGDLSTGETAVAFAALALTAVVAGRLLLTGHRVGTRLRSTRRRHRQLLDLMAQREAGLFVVEGKTPVAYCLPALQRSRVVVTRAATDALAPDELAAVVAHERAHLTARHDLVLEAFTVLHQAFPRWVSSRQALTEVRLLTEVLADAAARRRIGALPLARALVTLGERGVAAPASPGGARVALAVGGAHSQLTTRIDLLGDSGPHRGQAIALITAAVAVLVLPTLFVAYPWLAGLA